MSFAFNIPFKVERGGGVPTAQDYVQDGLIALWDGIENAGWGVHDPGQRYWFDLVAGHRLSSWGWNETCGWDGYSYNVLNRVDYGTIPIDYSAGMTLECLSGEFRNESQYQCVGVVGGNGSSDSIQYICIGGNVYGWIRGVTGFSDYMAHVFDNAMHTQTATIGTSGKIDFWADGGVKHVSIPESSFVMPSGSTATMSFTTKTRSTTESGPTYKCARIYNRVLLSDEIAHNASIDSARFNLA